MHGVTLYGGISKSKPYLLANLEPIQIETDSANVLVFKNQIYLSGGLIDYPTERISNKVHKYDPARNPGEAMNFNTESRWVHVGNMVDYR